MRTFDDTFSGTKIYPGKVRQILVCAVADSRSRQHLLDCDNC